MLLAFAALSLIPLPAQASDLPTFKVLSIVDGDTIRVDVRGNKETVRLLGIDAPESVDPRKPVQCFGKAASDKMKSFVAEKSVILVDERQQGNRDKYRRLLRYIYLPDSKRTFINGEMVKQGYAFSYRQYPTQMLDRFNAWEKYAREHNLGLWGSCPVTPSPKAATNTYIAPPPKANATPVTRTVPAAGGSSNANAAGGGFTCSGKTTCGQMSSCAEARSYMTVCGVSRLDGDKDGIPCESLCN